MESRSLCLLLAIAAAQLIRSSLYATKPLDPAVFAGVHCCSVVAIDLLGKRQSLPVECVVECRRSVRTARLARTTSDVRALAQLVYVSLPAAGIIVRNSIILVDFIELRVKQGMPLDQAVIDAGAVRFRPMMLTAAAVIAGSAVMLFDPIFQGLARSGNFTDGWRNRIPGSVPHDSPVVCYFANRKRSTWR